MRAAANTRPQWCESEGVLAAVVNTTVVADENLTVGSTVWLPAASIDPGR